MTKLRKLGRPTDHRNTMLRNQVTSLLRHGKLETTVSKAKETQRMTDKMITLGKRGDLHARRQALAYIYDQDIVNLLFDEIAPEYSERDGGYTRVLKLGPRRGDGAEMAILELV
ncbi:MAG TPA: 50S ribosomal protein L17 [Tissierellaceae bacterium]|nr:50S ribosomal protein L17 [Tissierellaceae bacterium]